ncbi:MAG TPA: hypothetical protein VES36_02710 [Candidatus Limnocylindrales bacterium]|nr:hypothetical protein [Candidatus Limnocylindrales bacterium]
MSRGPIYLGLLGALRHEELLAEAMRRQRSTDAVRRRNGQTLASRIRQALRGPKR